MKRTAAKHWWCCKDVFPVIFTHSQRRHQSSTTGIDCLCSCETQDTSWTTTLKLLCIDTMGSYFLPATPSQKAGKGEGVFCMFPRETVILIGSIILIAQKVVIDKPSTTKPCTWMVQAVIECRHMVSQIRCRNSMSNEVDSYFHLLALLNVTSPHIRKLCTCII